MTDDPTETVRLVIDNAAEIAAPATPSEPGSPPPPAEDPPPPEPPDDEGGGPRRRAYLPEGGPVTPLGLHGDMFYYLDANDQLRPIKAKDHGRLNLLALFGDAIGYLYATWPRVNKEGDTVGWRPELAAEALMDACARRGVWDVFGRVRGRGGWLAEGGGLVLHGGDGLVLADPERGLQDLWPGLIGRHVYPAAPGLPGPAEAPAAPGEAGPAGRLLDLFRAWQWARGETDAMLLLGWLGAAVLGGALDWRPLVWITGDRATGKSTLLSVLSDVLGEALLWVSDASAAGIWQKLGHASLPVALDEQEAEEDPRKAQAIIKLARQAASGGVVLRGGADHEGREFMARCCFLFSSILIPPLLGQDRSRMAILELNRLDGVSAPKLDPTALAGIGAGLRRRLLDQWPRWPETLAAYREVLGAVGHTGRAADQFGTLLAAADLLLADAEPDGETLAGWGEKLKAAGLAELADDAPDHERCLEHLRSAMADVYRSGRRRTVGSYIAEAAGQEPEGGLVDPAEASKVLGTLGLKVVFEAGGRYLAVANNHQGLVKLFHETHWAGRSGAQGVWVQALRRVPGAGRRGSALRFAGVSARCVLVPLDQVLPEGDEA